ncbi:MAG: DUF4956 domain-containing protein [Prevotella sp.]|nr:DUF4956 domain-containing protein [Prevotella sp.]
MEFMEELETFEATLIDASDIGSLLIRFLFNAIFIWFVIHKLYYPRSQRKDYYFTFAIISVSIFFLIYLLGGVKIKVGFALGLFAIFGIIRYRTESMNVREMTYLFTIIAMTVVNALGVTLSYGELFLTNLIFIVCIKLAENQPWLKHVSEKLVMYDRIDLITPEKREEMIEDLHKRLGVEIIKVEVGAVDFLRDIAMIKVYYDDPHETSNTVNKIMKFPKEG